MPLNDPYTKAVYRDNARTYKVMANPNRLELLNILGTHEATVSQLSSMIGIRKASVSQHLKRLKNLGMVKFRKSGKNVYYKLTSPKIIEPCRILKEFREFQRKENA